MVYRAHCALWFPVHHRRPTSSTDLTVVPRRLFLAATNSGFFLSELALTLLHPRRRGTPCGGRSAGNKPMEAIKRCYNLARHFSIVNIALSIIHLIGVFLLCQRFVHRDSTINTIQKRPAPSLAALEEDRQHDPRRALETCQRYLRCASQSNEDVIESVILVPAWEQLCRLQHGHCRQTAKLLQQYKNERSLGVAGMRDKICQTQQEYYESAEELPACELGLYKAQRRQQIRLKRQKYRQRQQQKSQTVDESSSSLSIDGVEYEEPFGDDPGSVTRRPTFP